MHPGEKNEDIDNDNSDDSDDNIIDNKNNPLSNYYWAPCPKNEISAEHLAILNKRIEEFKIELLSILNCLDLSSEDLQRVVARLCNDPCVKYKITHEKELKHFSDYVFDENEIMWDHDDLVNRCEGTMPIIMVPIDSLPLEERVKHYKKNYDSLIKKLKKLMEIKDLDAAIKYFMQSGDMWCNIPKIFKTIYPKNIECANAPTIKNGRLMNDWSDNYRLGAQIYIMIKNNIVRYVTDFYCPNT